MCYFQNQPSTIHLRWDYNWMMICTEIIRLELDTIILQKSYKNMKYQNHEHFKGNIVQKYFWEFLFKFTFGLLFSLEWLSSMRSDINFVFTFYFILFYLIWFDQVIVWKLRFSSIEKFFSILQQFRYLWTCTLFLDIICT
jgi:hypothetical protein